MWEIVLDSIPSGGKEEKERNLRWTFTVRYRVWWWWWEKENRSWFVRDTARYYVRYGKERKEVEPRENIGGIVVVVFFRQLFLVSSAISCGTFSLKTYLPKIDTDKVFFTEERYTIIYGALHSWQQLSHPRLKKEIVEWKQTELICQPWIVWCASICRERFQTLLACARKGGSHKHWRLNPPDENVNEFRTLRAPPSTRDRFIPLKCKLKCHS